MMELILYMEAAELFEDVMDSSEHDRIVDELVDGAWGLLYQFGQVIDYYRLNEPGKDPDIAIAAKLYQQAHARIGEAELLWVADRLSRPDSDAFISSSLRRGEPAVLPANPQPVYDAYSVAVEDAELTEHLIEHMSHGTVVDSNGHF